MSNAYGIEKQRRRPTLTQEVLSKDGCIGIGVVSTHHHQGIKLQCLGSVHSFGQIAGTLNFIPSTADHVEPSLVPEPCLQTATYLQPPSTVSLISVEGKKWQDHCNSTWYTAAICSSVACFKLLGARSYQLK